MSEHLSVPKEWAIVKLSEIIQPRGEKVSPQDFPDMPFLGMKNVEAHTSRIIATEPAKNFSSHASRFYAGDVLYGRLRPYLNKVVRPTFDGLASGEFIVLPENERVDGNFLKYRLISGDFVSFASHLNEGDRPRVNFKQIGDFELLLPPLSEQRRIVAKIEVLFSELDAGVAALEQARAQLKRYRQALLKAAFEGRLTEAWRRAHAGELESADALLARIRAERDARWRAQLAEWDADVRAWEVAGKPGRKPRKPRKPKALPPLSEEERAALPELPEGWAWVRVGNIAEVRLGRQRSPKNHSGPFMRPYLRAANATWDGVDLADVKQMNFSPEEFEIYRLHKGDILLAEASGSADEVGKPILWQEQIPDCCFQNTLIRVRLAEFLFPEFFHLHFLKDARTGRLAQISKGVGIHHLGAERLAALPVALPPLPEQHHIVAELDSHLSVMDYLDQTIEEALAGAAALRQAILKKAFSGRLVPQDPKDEPASVLLERVRAEASA